MQTNFNLTRTEYTDDLVIIGVILVSTEKAELCWLLFTNVKNGKVLDLIASVNACDAVARSINVQTS